MPRPKRHPSRFRSTPFHMPMIVPKGPADVAAHKELVSKPYNDPYYSYDNSDSSTEANSRPSRHISRRVRYAGQTVCPSKIFGSTSRVGPSVRSNCIHISRCKAKIEDLNASIKLLKREMSYIIQQRGHPLPSFLNINQDEDSSSLAPVQTPDITCSNQDLSTSHVGGSVCNNYYCIHKSECDANYDKLLAELLLLESQIMAYVMQPQGPPSIPNIDQDEDSCLPAPRTPDLTCSSSSSHEPQNQDSSS